MILTLLQTTKNKDTKAQSDPTPDFVNLLTQADTEAKTQHSYQKGKENEKIKSSISLEEHYIILRHSSFYTHFLLLLTASQKILLN